MTFLETILPFISILLTYTLISNLVLARFLGLCPFIGVSKNIESAVGMGLAVTFVMAIASLVTYLIQVFILDPQWLNALLAKSDAAYLTGEKAINLEYLRTVLFILVIASLVQFVEMIVQKFSPSLYKALGIYLPLITTNCAVMGIALINVDSVKEGAFNVASATGYNFGIIHCFVAGIAAGLGFMFTLIVMSAIRMRLDTEKVPKALKGAPIAFISAGLMALAFMAFDSSLIDNLFK